jgi:hypothetical protein
MPLQINTNIGGATLGHSPGPTQMTMDDFVNIRHSSTDLHNTRGGPIKLPHHADHQRLALKQKKSSCDIKGLANPLYHGEEQGYFSLMEQLIHNCGYTDINTTDVLHSLNDIMLLHQDIYTHWTHPCTGYEGPQLDRILEKGVPTFPRLTSIDIQSIVEFYDKFQKISASYLLPIMPFNCISIRMGFEALCPPGLGVPKYAAIARVLIEVLPKIILKSNSHINTLMMVICMETNNGFDLLWHVMALAVPGFDPTIPVQVPVWNNDDIFKFAAAFSLYYCLHGKKGVYHDDCMQSLTFLQAITEPAYAEGITSLLALLPPD